MAKTAVDSNISAYQCAVQTPQPPESAQWNGLSMPAKWLINKASRSHFMLNKQPLIVDPAIFT
jgi:hypothetical protein